MIPTQNDRLVIIYQGKVCCSFTSEPWKKGKVLKCTLLDSKPDHKNQNPTGGNSESVFFLASSMILVHIKTVDPLILGYFFHKNVLSTYPLGSQYFLFS